MSVVASIRELGPWRRSLTVEVPLPAVEAETDRVIQSYSKQVRIPGFRRGKVPRHLIRQRFHEDIEQEVIERLVPRYWKQAHAESNLDLLMPPEIQDVDLDAESGLTFVALVEIRPEIELKDIDNFDLPELDTEPTEEEIDESIEGLRRELSDWDLVERAAAEGDRVTGRLQEIDAEGEPFGEIHPIAVEVGSPRLWPELDGVLRGLEAGQEADFTRRDEGTEEARERTYRATVEEVRERALPELDDEFAARVGKFDSIAALREQARHGLRHSKEDERRHAREKALLDQVRERHPIDLPQGVLEQETRHLVEEYAGAMARQGVDLEQAGIDWEDIASRLRPQAERRVHARLLLDAIAVARETEVTEEEFEGALAALARSQGTTPLAMRRALDDAGKLSGFRAQLRRDKTLAKLLGEEPRAIPSLEDEETTDTEKAGPVGIESELESPPPGETSLGGEEE